MTKFAQDTDVPVEKTRIELERLLQVYKAKATGFFNSPDGAAVVFEMNERRILFRMRLPDPTAKEFTEGRVNQTKAIRPASEAVARGRWERACRRRWRALLLSIKAKLVSVDEGIETFEDAFLAHVVMPDGSTVGDNVRSSIASAYKTNRMTPLLPGAAKQLPPPGA